MTSGTRTTRLRELRSRNIRQLKRVTIVRHAKSDWSKNLPDIARPLNERGRRNAPEMGQRLAARGVVPDLILTSPAVRVRITAETIAAQIGYPTSDIEVIDDLYGADVEEVLEILMALDDSVGHVAVFGHNPCLTSFVNHVTGAGIANIPTCGVAELSFAAERWAGIENAEAKLLEFDYPKKV